MTSVLRRARILLIRVLRGLAHRIERPLAGQPTEPAPSWAPPELPRWVAEELAALAPMENELLPPGTDWRRYHYYSVPCEPAAGRFYFRLLEHLPEDRYDVVFLVPWLKPGGADRGTLHHLRALREIDPQWKILVLATEPAESPWADRVPVGVDFVAAGLLAHDAHFHQQVAAVTRLLIQLRPRVVHNINSRVGWELVKQHGLALRHHSTLVASLFCDDFTPDGLAVGYARDYLRDTYREFATVFCDNTVYPRIWNRELGVPATTFTVLPFPYDGVIADGACRQGEGRRILWAGRFDRQKRPDVLLSIAKGMPDVQFDVHGTEVLSQGVLPEMRELGALPNVTMHGAFRSFDAIVSPEHCAYLMTTSWEGLPTILLDAFAAGLPVVAPPVGGIIDLVPPAQLVDNPDDVAGFMKLLRHFIDNAADRRLVCGSQIEQLRSERSWQLFVDRLCGCGYFGTRQPASLGMT